MNKKKSLRRAPADVEHPPAHVRKMVENYKLRSKSPINRQQIDKIAAQILKQATRE